MKSNVPDKRGSEGMDGCRWRKPRGQAYRDGDGRVEEKLAQADADLAQAKAQVEADALEAAEREESVDNCVKQKKLVEDDEARGPGMLKPAEVDGKADRGEHEEVSPVAALCRIEAGCLPEKNRDDDGQCGVEREPLPTENAG